MKPKDLDTISGRLYIVNKEIPDAFFTYEDSIVTIIPNTDECRAYLYNNIKQENVNEWLNGFTTNGCFISFFRNTNFSHLITAPITLSTVRFSTQIIIKSKDPVPTHQVSFNTIVFKGKTIDLIYPPDLAIQDTLNRRTKKIDISINLNNKHEFNTNINNQNIKCTYGVDTSHIRYVAGQVIDLNKYIHSYLKFELDNQETFDSNSILKYYLYAKNLITFCAAAQNTTFDIILYQKWMIRRGEELIPTYNKFNVYLEDDYDNYIDEKLTFPKVINLYHLHQHLPELMTLLNEDNSKPYLEFLPKTNKYLNQILYTDIIDICTAVDREYARNNFEKNAEDQEQAKVLTKELLKFIKAYNCNEAVKTKASNILGSQLQAFSPSLKAKFIALSEKHVKDPGELSKINKYVGKLVKLRNDFAHEGFDRSTWNEGTKIYSNIVKLVYHSILSRAGFTDGDITKITANLHI